MFLMVYHAEVSRLPGENAETKPFGHNSLPEMWTLSLLE